MGMFDYFRSSLDIGAPFTDVLCHTKDIEDGIGGTMTTYWLDPRGVLWYPNYVGTNEFKAIEEDDPRYSPDKGYLNFEWIPTGLHGTYRPCLLTKYIEVYPGEWQGEWKDWPSIKLHFRNGVLQDCVTDRHE